LKFAIDVIPGALKVAIDVIPGAARSARATRGVFEAESRFGDLNGVRCRPFSQIVGSEPVGQAART
jgi:hypothetical protein